jgi:hypothetical protein
MSILRLFELLGLLPSLDIGESGARARLAFRNLARRRSIPLPRPGGKAQK